MSFATKTIAIALGLLLVQASSQIDAKAEAPAAVAPALTLNQDKNKSEKSSQAKGKTKAAYETTKRKADEKKLLDNAEKKRQYAAAKLRMTDALRQKKEFELKQSSKRLQDQSAKTRTLSDAQAREFASALSRERQARARAEDQLRQMQQEVQQVKAALERRLRDAQVAEARAVETAQAAERRAHEAAASARRNESGGSERQRHENLMRGLDSRIRELVKAAVREQLQDRTQQYKTQQDKTQQYRTQQDRQPRPRESSQRYQQSPYAHGNNNDRNRSDHNQSTRIMRARVGSRDGAQNKEEQRSVRVEKGDDGVRVIVIEKSDGGERTSQYHAGSLEQLRKSHPQAIQLLRQFQAQGVPQLKATGETKPAIKARLRKAPARPSGKGPTTYRLQLHSPDKDSSKKPQRIELKVDAEGTSAAAPRVIRKPNVPPKPRQIELKVEAQGRSAAPRVIRQQTTKPQQIELKVEVETDGTQKALDPAAIRKRILQSFNSRSSASDAAKIKLRAAPRKASDGASNKPAAKPRIRVDARSAPKPTSPKPTAASAGDRFIPHAATSRKVVNRKVESQSKTKIREFRRQMLKRQLESLKNGQDDSTKKLIDNLIEQLD